MRKGQVATQIFIYVIAVVVVGLIIAYGYSAIKGFSQKGEQVEYITLKTGIENAVKSIVSDYGSIKRPDISVPGKYEMLCFVNKEYAKTDQAKIVDTAICKLAGGYEEKYFQPIACEGWQTGRDNVFLIPDGSESFDVGNIVITKNNVQNSDFICIDVVNNKLNLQLKGLGDKVEVSTYENED